MNNPLRSDTSTSLGLLLARVPVGVVLALAGNAKFRGEGGLSGFVSEHLGEVPASMPSWFGNVYLHAVPFAEVGLGTLLVLGLLTRLSGGLAALMLVSFGMIQAGASGFVNARAPYASSLLQPPAIYATFALIAFFAGPGRISFDHRFWGKAGSKQGK